MNQPYMPQNNAPMPPAGGALPAELAQILAQYDQIVASFEQGYMSAEQAQAVLAALVVIDTSGALWSLDTHRQFTRRETPDTPAEVANPAQFSSAAPIAPAPAAAPVMPAGAVGPLSPLGNPSFPAAGMPIDDGMAGAKPAKARKPKSASSGKLKVWVMNNKPTVVVAIVAVVILAVVLLTRGGNASTPPANETATTTTSAAPGSTQALPALPANDRATAVLAALGSGDQPGTKQVLSKPGTPGELAVGAAQWVGFARLGLNVKTDGPPTRSGDKVNQTGTVSSPDGTKLATFALEWQRTDAGVWVLAGWPAVTPVR